MTVSASSNSSQVPQQIPQNNTPASKSAAYSHPEYSVQLSADGLKHAKGADADGDGDGH